MLSRLVTSALDKLSIKGSTSSSNSAESQYPTLSFPPPAPAGTGTSSICQRCLTLLSHITTQYGDGTGHDDLSIPHSSSIHFSSISGQTPSCVICAKMQALFDGMRAHTAFEPSLRKTPYCEWNLTWRINTDDPEKYPQFAFPHHSLDILMTARHKGGYGWGIGGFRIYPDWGGDSDHKDLGDYPVITSLDANTTVRNDAQKSGLNFSSTLDSGSLTLITSWAQECAGSHEKCHKIFGSKGLTQPPVRWFPDRLIQITRTVSSDATEVTITARVVLKSNSLDFPSEKVAAGINYLSLSHCWGPAPDPSAPLGGRAGTILIASNIAAWQTDLPIDDLPLTFQHAIMVCTQLGFEYMWIDSLCILQDSREDWQTQSAVMGDVYKFASFNVAALSSTSDYEGFINENRDPRVEFGFRAPFGSILGREPREKNSDGQECVLLHGQAKLLWNFSTDILKTLASNSALFTRAWVFQERHLARRTLAFSQNSVYWSCDEASYGEQPDWGNSGMSSSHVRRILHSVHNTIANPQAYSSLEPRQKVEQAQTLLKQFDTSWSFCVGNYTSCNLTKQTDKLIAFSSIARELADGKLLQKRYLAGLWDYNLPFQMAWITVEGKTAPPRKRFGDADFVAPSWSWASIEAPVQLRSIFNFGNEIIALADVSAAEVELATDYAFGAAKAGWLRISGHLNRVRASETKAYYHWDPQSKSTKLFDEATGEYLWFSPDTKEGYELVKSGKDLGKLVWMPLTLKFAPRMVDGTCLVLIPEYGPGTEGSFVREGEKVYRRLGSGNFGRVPSMLRQDKLLLGLGTYPDIQVRDEQAAVLAHGFKRKVEGFQEFVLI